MPESSEQRRHELGVFLRSRRARLTPAEVGLPDTRRRTPGLRREELALLAGMSATWYTYLEQGRDVQASDQVLGALASALRLGRSERDHLFRLAGRTAAVYVDQPLPPEVAGVRVPPRRAARSHAGDLFRSAVNSNADAASRMSRTG
ncbi:hypothetical protein GCM10022267_69980 [Lentzea roselyniae]|uniref:HTH cro/C1-type domain-containing protein n=1 Tax=Lentzea roselyniae TaxID=531940 RepID=A0ABP7BXZ3_9PSEU